MKRISALALAAGFLLLSGSAADASPKTLARSLSNITQGPLDMVLAPVTAGIGIVNNLRDIEDTTAVRVAYTLPGYFWYTGVCMGGGLMRVLNGLIEFVPGLVLLPFEADMGNMYAPIERAPGLFEYANEIFPIKFGIDYTATGG